MENLPLCPPFRVRLTASIRRQSALHASLRPREKETLNTIAEQFKQYLTKPRGANIECRRCDAVSDVCCR
jgi:hypothetical protein